MSQKAAPVRERMSASCVRVVVQVNDESFFALAHLCLAHDGGMDTHRRFNRDGWFPPSARAWEKEGDQCWEGGILERRDSAFVLHLQSADPLNPRLRTRYRVQKFRAAEAAIARLVRVRWGSAIDGIRIES